MSKNSKYDDMPPTQPTTAEPDTLPPQDKGPEQVADMAGHIKTLSDIQPMKMEESTSSSPFADKPQERSKGAHIDTILPPAPEGVNRAIYQVDDREVRVGDFVMGASYDGHPQRDIAGRVTSVDPRGTAQVTCLMADLSTPVAMALARDLHRIDLHEPPYRPKS